MAKHPALILAFLSPLVAEFLLGDQYLAGPPSFKQLGMLLEFVALYGCGALLIREVARRTGHGWPTMLTLALAFGVIEEGLLTQSLFNPDYVGVHLLSYGFIPALGIAGPWTVFVLTLHVVWSIATPIALVEALSGNREPWLKRSFGVVIALYVVGALGTFAISYAFGSHFLASPMQMTTAAVIAAALAVAAFTLFRTPSQADTGSNWLGLAIGLVASGAFQLIRDLPDHALNPWLMVTILLGLEALVVVAVRIWRPGTFGLAAGALLTYCWLGMLTAKDSGTGAIVEQSVLVALAVGLLLSRVRPRERSAVST
jgi:hypothetical protein